MLLGLLRARFLPAEMTEGDSPATQNVLPVLPAQGFPRQSQGKFPMLTKKLRCRVDCHVFPAVCAGSNTEVSPDPTPDEYISSALQLQLYVQCTAVPCTVDMDMKWANGDVFGISSGRIQGSAPAGCEPCDGQ